MRIRFTGAIVALAGAAVVTLAVMPIAGQAPQGGGDGERRRPRHRHRRGGARHAAWRASRGTRT
jgi:hypothetical protein